MFGEFCGGSEISLTECRAPTTPAAFYEHNLESERFEHFHRSDTDVRLVITYKRVVPKDDMAAVLKERRFGTAGVIWRSPFLVGGV